MIPNITQEAFLVWTKANQAYLQGELELLRLLLHRRVLWLRKNWSHDPLKSYQGLVISDAQIDGLLCNEDTFAEEQFYREDIDASQLSNSIDLMKRKLNEQKSMLSEAGKPPALEVLVHLFGLTNFERKVILLCLAPELDLDFERLYAYVQDDVNIKHPTPHLALSLFGGDDPSVAWESFLPEAPLRRFGLVNMEEGSQPGSSASTLGIDERIVGYLRGVNLIDRRVFDLLRPMNVALLAPSHIDHVNRLTNLIEFQRNQSSFGALNLLGQKSAGKWSVAKEFCNRLGMQLYVLDVGRVPAQGPERMDMLRLLEREAILFQLAVYLDLEEIDSHDKQVLASINDLIENLAVFLIVASAKRFTTNREMVAVQVQKPDAIEQQMLWQQALEGDEISIEGEVDAIVQQFDFGPESIVQSVNAAKYGALMRSGMDCNLAMQDLWHACRGQSSWQMEELAQRIISPYTWDDIVLSEDVFRQIQEIAAQVENRAKVYEEWGFGERLSHVRGISALFAGPSGTGKTMAAEILANHLDLDLYRIDLASVVSKYIGETEKNLKSVFDAAEESGAILFFDEADALFGRRTEVKDSHDRYANIEVNYLLQRMEDYRGLAILATNRKSALDRAFLRRLRFLVDFPFPVAENRRIIWQKVFPPKADVGKLDYAALARLEISGGNIRNIALNAAFLAAGDKAAIEMKHVMHAARREYAKIDKLVTENEFGAYYTRSS